MFRSYEAASSTGRGECPRRDLKHEIKRCSLEILRRRELIESLEVFSPLSSAATPLFELALEVACQVYRRRAPYSLTATRTWSADLNERWLDAINELSFVCSNLPERRNVEFLEFWFASDESEDPSKCSANVVRSARDDTEEDDELQHLAEDLLDDAHNASMTPETDLPEDLFEEPADIGGDMNITLEFVHIANRVFDDTETLIARFAAQLQSIGRELVELLGELDSHAPGIEGGKE